MRYIKHLPLLFFGLTLAAPSHAAFTMRQPSARSAAMGSAFLAASKARVAVDSAPVIR